MRLVEGWQRVVIRNREKPRIAAARFALLSAIAKADGAICQSELRAAEAISGDFLRLSHAKSSQLFEKMCGLTEAHAEDALWELSRRPIEERERTIQLLWIMAICNGDLSMSQEKLIYQYADRLSVSRRALALQQPDFGLH